MPRSGGLYYTTQAQHKMGTPVLILIHGAGGSSAIWPYQLRRLPGWRVFAPDLPGHGSSHSAPLGSLEEYAACLWEWADSLGIEEAVLCGHSMGAAVALHMALLAQKRVSGLVLLGAAARFSVNPGLMEKLHSPPRLPDAVRSIVQWSFARGAHPSLRSAYTRQLQHNAPETLYGDFKACVGYSFAEQAQRVRVPALVLSGAEDQMVPSHLSAALAQQLPLAIYENVLRAGHMLMQEQPEGVSTVVENTLQNWK